MMKQYLLLGALITGGCAETVEAAQTLYVANTLSSAPGLVYPIPTATNIPSTGISVADMPARIAITPDGSRAYVVSPVSGVVTPITIATNSPGSPITVGPFPQGIVITADGSTAYVVHAGTPASISSINLATNTVGATTPLTGYEVTLGILAISGSMLYIPVGTPSSPFFVLAVTIAGPTPVIEAAIPVGNTPIGIAVTPDGTTAYVANGGDNTLTPINLATNSPGLAIFAGLFPRTVAITPDGTQAYVTDAASSLAIISTATNTFTGSIPLPGFIPQDLVITADGKMAYVSVTGATNGILAIDLVTQTVVATIVPVTPANFNLSLALTPASAQPASPVPTAVTGLLQKNVFLNVTERVLTITWQPSIQQGVLFYRIYNGTNIIGTVMADQPLSFITRVNRAMVAQGFSVTAVTAAGQGVPIPVPISS